MHTLKPTILVLAALMATVGICGATGGTNAAPDAKARRAKFQEMFDRLQPAHIYGKVVDQEGHPIAGADVKIDWETAALMIGKQDFGQTTWVKSDDKGLWEFKIEKPFRAFVAEVKRAGFEYTTRYNQESSVRNLVEQRTTPDAPVVTVLRKKGETTFLIVIPSGNRIGDQLIRVFSPESQTNTLDLLAEKGEKSKAVGYADLEAAVNFDAPTGAWTVTYSATNGTDGIIIGDNLLYEAPQDGYQKEIVLHGPPWPRYLYLRSRTPAIYSRLDLEHSTWKESETKQGFRISYKAWINPYGSRNLEYESDLAAQWQLRKQLEREAKADLLQNKRPSKPDLPKLVKEAKEKADKGKP